MANKKKVLVTGACGFVGGYMCRLLLKLGYDVTGIDLPGANRASLEKSCTFYEADLTRKETLEKPLKGVHAVFHPAAVFSYSANRELLWSVNVEGTRNLCHVMLDQGVKRLINWSTAGVYGYQDPRWHPYKEEAPKKPSNLYEESKLEQEHVVENMQKKGLIWTTIRPAPIYGPRNVYGVAQIILTLARPPVLFVPKNFDQFKMPFVHVIDVVRAALFLFENKKSEFEAYNVVDDSTHSAYEFVHFLGEKLNKRVIDLPPMNSKRLRQFSEAIAPASLWLNKIFKSIPVLEKESLVYIGQSFWFSNEKLKKLGFTFKYADVFQGIERTLRWYKRKKFI